MAVGMFTGAREACRYKGCYCCEADVFGGAEKVRDEPPVLVWHSAGLTVQGL